MNPQRSLTILTLVGLGALARLLPHPPNFTPVLALSLFAGATWQNPRWAWSLPLAAMLLSDVWIVTQRVLPSMGGEILGAIFFLNAVVYLVIAATSYLGMRLGPRPTLRTSIGAGLVASIIFFGVTNAANWWVFDRLAGGDLWTCYVRGLPFFKNTLASTFLYAAMFFGSLRLGERVWPRLRLPDPVPHGQA